jgi:hypothetical protein
MEETLASRTMAEIDLIKNLEKISSEIPNRILKIQGYILKKKSQRTIRNNYFQRFQQLNHSSN